MVEPPEQCQRYGMNLACRRAVASELSDALPVHDAFGAFDRAEFRVHRNRTLNGRSNIFLPICSERGAARAEAGFSLTARWSAADRRSIDVGLHRANTCAHDLPSTCRARASQLPFPCLVPLIDVTPHDVQHVSTGIASHDWGNRWDGIAESSCACSWQSSQ